MNLREEISSAGFSEVMAKPLSSARAHSFLSGCSSNKNNEWAPPTLPLKDLNTTTTTESPYQAIEDLAIIDLRLGLDRMSAKNDEKAVIGIGLLVDSLKDDS